MNKLLKKVSYSLSVALGISMISSAAIAKTELTMYYPVAVGGALTQTVDAIVADFMSENPDIEVNAIYSGNYDDTRIKALAALESGKPAQLSVMFSIDVHELRELDAIIPFDDVVSTSEEKAWLNSFYPSLMENGIAAGKTWGIPFNAQLLLCTTTKMHFVKLV